MQLYIAALLIGLSKPIAILTTSGCRRLRCGSAMGSAHLVDSDHWLHFFASSRGISRALLSSFIRLVRRSLERRQIEYSRTLCHGVVKRSRIPHSLLGKTRPTCHAVALRRRMLTIFRKNSLLYFALYRRFADWLSSMPEVFISDASTLLWLLLYLLQRHFYSRLWLFSDLFSPLRLFRSIHPACIQLRGQLGPRLF